MIETLELTDLAPAAAVLARAFRDNPGMVAVLKGDTAEERRRILQVTMLGFAKAVLRAGQAECIKRDGLPVAVSLAYPPGAFPPPLTAQLTIATGPLLAGPRRALRFALADVFMRAQHIAEPHWYLWVLGVDPELQGRGFGSELLRSLSAKADRERVPCYLETDKASSVRLYERHGYVVQRESTHLRLGLRLWFMLRPPSAR